MPPGRGAGRDFQSCRLFAGGPLGRRLAGRYGVWWTNRPKQLPMTWQDMPCTRWRRAGGTGCWRTCSNPVWGKTPRPCCLRWSGRRWRRSVRLPTRTFGSRPLKPTNGRSGGPLPVCACFKRRPYPRLPFYDTRISDFFGTVPSTFVSRRRLQIDYLKRYAPDLARIKWQVYDTNLFRYQFFNSWLLPKRAVKKAWRLLRGKTRN